MTHNKTIAKRNASVAGIEGIDFITCMHCGSKLKELSNHYKRYHPHESIPEITKCASICDKMKGENNPAYQHGGKFSPFSKEFVNYTDEEQRKTSLKKQGETRKKNGTNPFTREYYDSDEDFSKAQTRDLQWFIDKYGEIEGKKKHIEKTEKWMKSFKKVNFSKISQELFSVIMESYVGDVYFATYERPEMTDYKNKEYILKLSESFCRPDFICLKSKKVIEFDGDYWHSEAVANPLRESLRDSRILEQGYDVLHIKECDYKNDKQGILEKCLNFLIA